MKKQFLEVKTKKEAEKLALWACKIIKVENGYLAFENYEDFYTHCNQK